MKYLLELQDDQFGDKSIEFEKRPTREEIKESIADWCQDGDWGKDGAVINVDWMLLED